MYRVQHKETEQVCEFDTEESLDGFMEGIADPHKWAVLEEAPGVHVELTGKLVEPTGNAAQLTEDVLDKAAKDIVAGAFGLAYAASGIADHYKLDRADILARLTGKVAPLLNVAPEAVDGELERRATERNAVKPQSE